MFEYLEESVDEGAIQAGHHAIQYMRQWALVDADRSGVAAEEDSSLTPAQISLVERIVGDIEDVEGLPVTQLAREKVDGYISQVSDRLQVLSRKHWQTGRQNGRALLDQLRKRFDT